MTISECVMATITTLALFAAIGTGVVIWSQLNEMKTDQRAWVGFDEIKTWTLEAEKPFSITVPVRNVGKTPAKNVGVGFVAVFRNKGEIPAYDELVKPYVGIPSALYLPNQSHEMTANIQGKDSGVIKGDFVNKVNSGEFIIYAIGKVTYIDVFNKPHWTEYCYASDRIGPGVLKFRTCPGHNGIDTEEQ